MKLTLAHSPDADDAFMFSPLFSGKIDTQGLEIEEIREDIESLNKKAAEGVYDVTALSFHAYPYVQVNYLLLPAGACFGESYGPVLVSNKPLRPKQILKLRCAVPGKKTTAFLVLKFWERTVSGEGRSGVSYTEVPFDQVMNLVAEKKMDLGLLIHEGQLTYEEKGLHKVVDLGEWWTKETSLPLPLGAVAVRRELDWETQKKVNEVIRQSIQYSLDHREESIKAAMPFARGLDEEKAGKFIGMYVNELTLDLGRKGLKAIRKLFHKGFQLGVLPFSVDVEGSVLNLLESPPPPDVFESSEPVSEIQPEGSEITEENVEEPTEEENQS